MSSDTPLPIEPLLPRLRDTLRKSTRVVLEAPPGAGKTTRVPLALLHEPWLEGRRILMLEPRRLAARSAARFMARRLGERVGETVGYRTRLESRVGPGTRIEVLTEGILTRMLQEDQALETAALVIFDEFHERSLQADLGLALCLDSQATLREELRILVMSATLDGAAVARLLEGAPVLSSEGRGYPVETRYRPLASDFARQRRAFCSGVATRIREVLREEHGNLLVFLPGVGEIRQLESALQTLVDEQGLIVTPLHGNLDARAQDAATGPPPPGRRKVVLATSIAETSLTLEGIRVVVDAGLMRLPRFDPATGLTRLDTVPVSQATADQRRGRAGRQQAGVCYRLWPKGRQLLAHTPAEILAADLAPLLLELARWGVSDAAGLAWLDAPPAAPLAQAAELLRRLGALDADGRISAHGREMARFGAHPRLAHMMIRGHELGHGALACELAALLGERDPLRPVQAAGTDIQLRLEALHGNNPAADRGALKRIRVTAERWRRQLGCPAPAEDQRDLSMAGVLLAFAYPDRIGLRRPGGDGRYQLSSGRGARFGEAEPLAAEEMIVAAFLDGRSEARIFLAAGVAPEQLLEYHQPLFSTRRFVVWDRTRQCVQARRQQRLGALVIADESWTEAAPDAVLAALLEGIRHQGPGCLPWNEAARQLQARVELLRKLFGDPWPAVDDASLMATLEEWLAPWLQGLSRLEQLKKLDLQQILLAMLPWERRNELERLAPTHLQVPSGSRIRLDYGGDTPVLAVRLQEMFGLAETPSIAGGRLTVLVQLLSPARRPLQLTGDLGAFWKGSYREVRKEMRGRYPKHHWPEDPLQAQPTTRTRRRKEQKP